MVTQGVEEGDGWSVKRREFLDAAAIARASHAGSPAEVAAFSFALLDELDKIELSRPLDLLRGKEWWGENLSKIVEFVDALPEKTQDTFLGLLRERYGSRARP